MPIKLAWRVKHTPMRGVDLMAYPSFAESRNRQIAWFALVGEVGSSFCATICEASVVGTVPA